MNNIKEIKLINDNKDIEVLTIRILNCGEEKKFMELYNELNTNDKEKYFMGKIPEDSILENAMKTRIKEHLVLGCFDKNEKLVSVIMSLMELEKKDKGEEFDSEIMLPELKQVPLIQQRGYITSKQYRGKGLMSILQHELRKLLRKIINTKLENLNKKERQLKKSINKLNIKDKKIHMCSIAVKNNPSSVLSSLRSGMKITGINETNIITTIPLDDKDCLRNLEDCLYELNSILDKGLSLK